MALTSSVMGNKKFGYFILSAFIAGTILLITVQINSARNTGKLILNNNTLLKELKSANHLREIDRDILGVESRIRASIATNDTSHLEGVDQKVSQVTSFLDSISRDNTDTAIQRLIDRLNFLALEKMKTKTKLLERFYRLGNMNDTSSIANPRARRISDEITRNTGKIYQSRQVLMQQLSRNSEDMGRKAHIYDISILGLLLVSGGAICIYILRQFRRQHLLIAKLNVSQQKALVAAEAKENFLANMSHEIRTPLSGILGFTNLLQRKKLDVDSAEFVDSIQKSGENLMAIVNDILDLSKIEAGMMRIVPGIFSVSGLVHSVETLFSERVREKNLTLTTHVEPGIPDTLKGDATRLTQVLVNLLGNSVKFTRQGSITVEVYKKEIKGDRILLGFRVSDTGIGISTDKLDQVFDRFNQGEDSVTRNYGGTGLGLSIVKNLLRLQDGNIEVSSDGTSGTTFDFYIPYLISPEQLDRQTATGLLPMSDKPYQHLQILVVDDNITNQTLMKHLLRQWEVRFEIVADGAAAVEQLRFQAFDLVLMDIQMPQMDGYTATRLIREELKLDLPVIAMTAHAMAGEREKCLSRGMNGYISKPINEEELFDLISTFGLGKMEQAVPVISAINQVYKYIDLSYMRSVSGGDRSFELDVTQQFIENVPADVDRISQACKNADTDLLHLVAHDLRSSVAIMGLLPILEPSLDLLETSVAAAPALLPVVDQIRHIVNQAVAEARMFATAR